MKLAVSIPDELGAEADRAARDLGLSRSALYGRALAEFLRARSDRHMTERIDELMSQLGSPRSEFVSAAARRRLAESEW
ncbi:MAG: hypothetical protein ACEQR8_07415 [Cypionkella sp.]